MKTGETRFCFKKLENGLQRERLTWSDLRTATTALFHFTLWACVLKVAVNLSQAVYINGSCFKFTQPLCIFEWRPQSIYIWSNYWYVKIYWCLLTDCFLAVLHFSCSFYPLLLPSFVNWWFFVTIPLFVFCKSGTDFCFLVTTRLTQNILQIEKSILCWIQKLGLNTETLPLYSPAS